jgi:hypothetical protein
LIILDGKTTTFSGKGKEEGDVDGTLQSARFDNPWDIVKDDENDDILYVSDSCNHKIKMIDINKGNSHILIQISFIHHLFINIIHYCNIDSYLID